MSVFRKIKSFLPFFGIVCAIALFLSAPARYAESVLRGITLWFTAVFPSTFPFLFLTGVVTHSPVYGRISNKLSRPMGKLFGVSGTGGGVMLLSALSGYPIGARTVGDLSRSGTIGQEERLRLACLCSTSGPMFLVGTVGGMLYQSALSGVVLLVSHLSAVLLTGIVSRPFVRAPQPSRPIAVSRSSLSDEMTRSVSAVLSIGGFIALFTCFSQMLGDLGLFRFAPFGAYSAGIFQGLLEMTTGCNALSAIKTPLSLALSCMLVTWGGVCVLAQQFAFLSGAVKPAPFLLVKLIQAAIAFFLCLALASLVSIF